MKKLSLNTLETVQGGVCNTTLHELTGICSPCYFLGVAVGAAETVVTTLGMRDIDFDSLRNCAA